MEQALGLPGAAVLVGAALLAAAAVYTTPALGPVNHGVAFAELSRAPLDFETANPLRYRILSPLVAHVLGLRGDLFVFFPLGVAVLLLAGIYAWSRRRGLGPAESVGVAALLAFSSPILFTLHFQGYTDTVSYALLFGAWLLRTRLVFSAALFALALLNHEGNLFLAPWLLFGWLEGRRGVRAVAPGLAAVALAALPALAWRAYVSRYAEVDYTVLHYLDSWHLWSFLFHTARGLWLGIFMAFKLFWALPILAAREARGRGDRAALAALALPVAGALASLAVGTDTSRLVGLAFPSILLAALALRGRTLEGRPFREWLWILIGWNLLVPQYYVGQSWAFVFFPLPVTVVLEMVFGFDTRHPLWWGNAP